MKKIFAVLVLVALVSLVLANAGDTNGGRTKKIIGEGDVNSFIAKGCVQKPLDLRTAFALDCPSDADLGGLNAYADVRVFAFDLNADKQVKADLVWGNYTGSGRSVAVVDTGIAYSHAELASSYLGGTDLVNNDADPFDDNSHGTHVAGIITADGVSANAKGVAPNAGVYAVKVLDASGSGALSTVIAGIYWAADNTAADVISLSLGTSSVWKQGNCDSAYPAMTDAVNYAVGKGKVVVVAAGNSPGGVSLPGCISSTVVVGAVDKKDKIASFSGRGFALKNHGIVAPGVGIYSSIPSSYASYSGTSMATPLVSGVIALMKQKNPALTVAQIKGILFSTGKDLGSARCDTTYGCGRVDAQAAVQAS
ncbi:TPA: S8 family serine peptidase [Candidatus Micrarchaeota archaeon]|nr:S8 family serine peptidase [Candidatus Micrarchaeota archaeon]